MKPIKSTRQLMLMLFIVVGGVSGQTAEAKLTKEELISNVWKAMFGELKDKDIKSVYFEGFTEFETQRSRVTIKRPNSFRNVVDSGVLVFDGYRAAWASRKPDAEGNPRNPEMIELKSWRHFEVDIALAFPAFFDYPCEFKRLQKVNSPDEYSLHVPLPLGGEVTYFVDGRSFLVKRRLVNWNGDSSLWENLIEGHVKYDGGLFADGYVYKNRGGKQKLCYKNVKFNINPKDELFEIPKELGKK